MTVSQIRPSNEPNETNKQLLKAAKLGEADKVFQLLQRPNASPLADDNAGKTVSIWLSYFNNGRAVINLAQKWPEVLHEQDSFGRTSALWLAVHGNGDAVLALAEIDIRVLTHADNEGKTPLMMLARYDNKINKERKTSTGLEVLFGLSKAPCHITEELASLRPELLTQTDVYGRTVAAYLAQHGDEDVIVRLALEAPFVLKQQCQIGANIALWLAIRGCNTAVVELAEYAPSDVLDVVDDEGFTAGSWLAWYGAGDKLLALANIYPAVKEQPGIVKQAVKALDAPLAKQLIRAGFALPDDFDALLDEKGIKPADVGLTEVA